MMEIVKSYFEAAGIGFLLFSVTFMAAHGDDRLWDRILHIGFVILAFPFLGFLMLGITRLAIMGFNHP